MSLRKFAAKRRKLLGAKRVSLGDGLHGNVKPIGGLYRVMKKWMPKKTLYIGKAKNLRQRLYSNLMKGQTRSHTLKGKLIRARVCLSEDEARRFLSSNCYVQFIEIDDARERSFVEHYLIAAEQPRYND